MTDDDNAFASIRSCDGCTLCCKIIGIQELESPAGAWCRHCKIGSGCSIYETRPGECRTFRCAYLVDPDLDETWKPNESKIVVMMNTVDNRLEAHVDTHRPHAWKQAPYYAQLKAWSKLVMQHGAQLIVFVGRQRIQILPDRDVDLGPLFEDQVVATRKRAAPIGATYRGRKERRTGSVEWP